jgi:murein DD-endopeptidase MepM/ murein hydrolase activator NlpD
MTWKERMQRWRGNLNNRFRFVIMNDETFEEVGSYKLTLMNVYVAISTLLVFFTVLVFMLIAYTPIKSYLPGFQATSNDRELLELTREVNRMDREMRAQQTYIKNLQRMMGGTPETVRDVPQVIPATKDSSSPAKKISQSEVDEQLRQEVELAKIGKLAQQVRGNVKLVSAEKPIEQLFFVSPLKGEISAHFDRKKDHYGIDILAPKNTPIKATMDGYVVVSDWTLETGNTIGIQHDNGILSFYKHNSTLLKKAGSYVRAGEAIAIIGNTGTLTSGPHLHFELWQKGKPLNPADYVNF